jgi:hypothetical protein
VDHCPNFDTFSSGTIQPGSVDELGGCTPTSGLGISPEWALVGRVEMTANTEGQTNLTTVCANTSCSIIGYGAVSCSQITFESNVVTIEGCIYDFDGDEFIGPGDLSLFACCWLHPASDNGCGDIIPCIDSDFDCDGFVGPGDLSWFATGWLKQCSDPSILLPPCHSADQALADTAAPVSGYPARDGVVRLITLTSPSPSDTTDTLPRSISSVSVGKDYYFEVWVTDIGSTNTGLTSVYVDLIMDSSDSALIQSIEQGGIFTVFASGAISSNGIDELGGSSLTGAGKGPGWARVAVVKMRAGSGGIASCRLAISRTGIAALGRGSIPWSEIYLSDSRESSICGDIGHPYPVGDLDYDCRVDWLDMKVFLSYWLETGCIADEQCYRADLDKNGYIDFEDFCILSAYWLECAALD